MSDEDDVSCIDLEARVADVVGDVADVVGDVAADASTSTIAPAAARRKWTDDADILLLKEVAARKAHVPVFGKAMETFAAIAEALRGKLPWETDAKHCRDRYTLLTRTFTKSDRIGRSSTGVEEDFTEREILLTGLIEEAVLWKEKRTHDKSKDQERHERLMAAGSEARALALSGCGGAYVSADSEMRRVPERAARVLELAGSNRTPTGSNGSADLCEFEDDDMPSGCDVQAEEDGQDGSRTTHEAVRGRRKKRKAEQSSPIQREDVYCKLFKIEADNAARAEKQFDLDSRRLSLEQQKIAADREERQLDRQARAAERAVDREAQQKQSEGLNEVLMLMSQSQKAIQEGFLGVLNRVLEKH
jgi:hypothetical protein